MKTLSAEDIKKLQDLEKHMGTKLSVKILLSNLLSLLLNVPRLVYPISDALSEVFFLGPTGVGKTELRKSSLASIMEMKRRLSKSICQNFLSVIRDQNLLVLRQVLWGTKGGMLTEKSEENPIQSFCLMR